MLSCLISIFYSLDHLLHAIIVRILPHWQAQEPYFWHSFLYRFPKFILAACMLYWLCMLVLNNKCKNMVLSYGAALVYAVVLIMGVAKLKWLTDVSCPWDHVLYGGILDPKTWLNHGGPFQYYECFPAGHATCGFAFLGWCFSVNKKYYPAFFVLGVFLGCMLGFYQMLRGAHYLSHTITTLFLALLWFFLVDRLLWLWK